MAMHVDLHADPETVKTSSRFHENEKYPKYNFIAVDLTSGEATVRMFLRSVKDLDALAFEFETLAREARERKFFEQEEADK